MYDKVSVECPVCGYTYDMGDSQPTDCACPQCNYKTKEDEMKRMVEVSDALLDIRECRERIQKCPT